MLNKIVLVVIALGLWANAISTWVRPAGAQSAQGEIYLSEIAYNTRTLMNGGRGCRNTKICD